MIQLYYKRKHLPSGRIYMDKFNPVQVPGLDHFAFGTVERECRKTVEMWNRQQPDTWAYEYIGVRNAEVLAYESKEAVCL